MCQLRWQVLINQLHRTCFTQNDRSGFGCLVKAGVIVAQPPKHLGWKDDSVTAGVFHTFLDPTSERPFIQSVRKQSSFSLLSSLPVMYCSDPGHVEHSTRSLSDPKLLVGTTIQYSCNPGFVLQGGATITCYGREPGTPVWTSRLPHCVCEYQRERVYCFWCKKEEKPWKVSRWFIKLVGWKGLLV